MPSLKCPQGHTFGTRPVPGDFTCDVCKDDGAANEQALKCASCDYDVCVGCLSSQNALKCPNYHVLVKTVTTHGRGDLSCDKCKKLIVGDSSAASCRGCDFDLCFKCALIEAESADDGQTTKEEVPTKALSTIQGMWDEVGRLQAKRLPKSVMKIVKEHIMPAARAVNDHGQLLKALVYLAKATVETEDVEVDVGISMIEAELKTPTFITGASETAFVHSMLGELYERYLQLMRYQISSRTDLGEDSPLPADIKVWSAAQLERVSFEHYMKSVEHPEQLAAEKTSDYDMLLTAPHRETSLEAAQRPTLLDFLGHRALSFFSNENSYLSEPSNRFVLRDCNALSDARTFVGISFETSDVTSRRFRALQVYQAMLRIKLAAAEGVADDDVRKRALFSLCALDLARVAFVRNSIKGVSTRELRRMVLKALQDILQYAKGTMGEGPALNTIAKHYTSEPIARQQSFSPDGEAPTKTGDLDEDDGPERFELPAALRYYREALEVSEATSNHVAEDEARDGIRSIEQTSLNAYVERVVAPNMPILVSTNTQNIGVIVYRVVMLTSAEEEELDELKGGNEARSAYLLAISKILHPDTEVDLGREPDEHYLRLVEFVVGALSEPGRYRLLLWPRGPLPGSSHFVVVPFTVSRIAIMTSVVDRTHRFVVVDRTTGEPLEGVKGTLYTREWTNGKYKKIHCGSEKSDANGFIKFWKLFSNYYKVFFTMGDDVLDTEDSYNNHNYGWSSSDDYSSTNTYFFLDRNIYRPGQTIYFKGLQVATNSKGLQKVCKGATVRVTFRDANYQERESLMLTTNDYGSFEGTFTAPVSGRTGSMQLLSKHGSVSFKVEEYKRPKFEVALSAPAQNVRVGEKAKVEGLAKNFSGIPLAGASVRFRVRRVARAPWFWSFWCRSPRWAGKSAEILSGTATADESGKFVVRFVALPDEELSPDDRPEFDYEVTVDVMDVTGETQTAKTSIKVGYLALKVDVYLQDSMSLESLRSLPVSLSDLNGNPMSSTAEITLQKLVAPFPAGCPFVARMWKVPDKIVGDKAAFKRALPQFAYTDEDAPRKWPLDNGHRELSRNVTCDGVKPAPPVNLDCSELAPNTYYKISVKATDSYGAQIAVSRTVQVFDETQPRSIALCSEGPPCVRFSQPSYRVGDVAVVTYGKRVRFDGRPQPALVILSSASKCGSLEWERNGPEGGIETTLVQRSLSVKEKDRGHLRAVCAFVAYGRVYTNNDSVAVPWTEKRLVFECVSFRNKLEPGQEEEWRIKVKSADPLCASNEHVAAEVVAALYDASLDTLLGNREHSFRNSIFNTFPMPTPDVSINAGMGYHSLPGKDYSGSLLTTRSTWNRTLDFPQLNWFGLPIDQRRRFGRGLRELDECLDGVVTLCCATKFQKKGRFFSAPGSRGGGAAKEEKEESCKKRSKRDEGGAPAANNDSSNGDDASDDKDENAAPPTAVVRTNLQETVFFMSNLRTEPDGTVVLRFKMGEALTRWRFLAFAHTTDLKTGTHSDGNIITQRELMVTPNTPRFLREGDTMRFTAKVSNMSATPCEGVATLELFDEVTGASLNEVFGLLSLSDAKIKFVCAGGGQSSVVEWPIKVPFGCTSLVTWRIVARSSRGVGDGEESSIPVVTNRMLVTDTLPMSVRGGQQKQFTLKSLAASSASGTLAHKAYTVEFTSNPAWYAVQALPYMMEFPHECSEQLFTRFYSNTLASHITKKQPQIQRVFEAWRLLGSNALKSNLNLNEELKSAMLEETPWVAESQSEERQRKQIALLFDLNRMRSERDRALGKLRSRQMRDGGFSWFPGGPGSLFISQHIAMGLAHLVHLGADDTDAGGDIQRKAQSFCHTEIIEEYDRLLESVQLGLTTLEEQHVDHHHLLFLYTESFAALHPKQLRSQTTRPEVLLYYREQAAKFWTSFSLYGQALIALIAHRCDVDSLKTVSQEVARSLRERSLHDDAQGAYFRYDRGFRFFEAPIETHTLMIEVFSEVAGDSHFVDELRLWLLKNKQTKHWKTTKQTSEAVYALLLGGESWLGTNELVSVTVGGVPLPMVNPEPGTGYVKHRYEKTEITPAMAKISVANPNKTVAWGAAYWQYFEDLDKVKDFEETPLKISKSILRVELNEAGEVLRPLLQKANGDNDCSVSPLLLALGDKVKIRIEIRCDREMSYVHLKDMRASGFEPVNVISQFKWQDGLGYYESTKDLATHFFIDRLPKGTFVFEYTLIASQRGEFSNGVTTMQCMYAPEFTAHSEGVRLAIE